MRRTIKNRNIVKPDDVYQSARVGKFINHIMRAGKKDVARSVVYRALEEIKEKEKVEDPIVVFDTAIQNVGPLMEIRSRRVGGANYQVPREVRADRRETLAMRWIIEASRSGSGSPMHTRLAEELILASKGEGNAVKKRENTHKMAEANKAFAHFSW